MSNRCPIFQQRRFQSIEMEPMDDSSDNSNQTWLQDGLNSMQLKRSEMNELIMDYLVHEGFKEAAERFREEAGIEPSNLKLTTDNEASNNNDTSSQTIKIESQGFAINNNSNSINEGGKKEPAQQQQQQKSSSLGKNDPQGTNENVGQFNGDWITNTIETPEMMDRRIEVRRSIEDGDILKAQSLINLYYPELLDNHRNLYFKLQQQHLIELIRQEKVTEVLAYVHDHLNVDELRDLTEMERTLALLAYEHPDKSPYASMLQTSHRLQLASEINDIVLQESSGNFEPNKPRLVTLLKLLFWTQSELERKKIQFPKMTDLVNGTILEPRH